MGKLSQSYLKELAEKKKYKSGGFSTEGYKRNSPDVNNPYNIIPSNQITMEGVDFPVMGIDDIGNQQIMYPGNNYTYPGNYVTEFPIKNMGNKRFGQVGFQNRGEESTEDTPIEMPYVEIIAKRNPLARVKPYKWDPNARSPLAKNTQPQDQLRTQYYRKPEEQMAGISETKKEDLRRKISGVLRETTQADKDWAAEQANRKALTFSGATDGSVLGGMLDLVNPFSYYYAGKDAVRGAGETAQAIYEGNPDAVAAGLFKTGLNAAAFLPATQIGKFANTIGNEARLINRLKPLSVQRNLGDISKEAYKSLGRKVYQETARNPFNVSDIPMFRSAFVNEADDFLRGARSVDDFSTSQPFNYETQLGLGSGPVSSTPAISRVGQAVRPVVSTSSNLGKKFGTNLEHADAFLGQVAGEIFQGQKNRAAIAKGNEWLNKWIQSPVTQAKIESDLGWVPQRGNVLTQDVYDLGYEQAKNFVPNVGEYPLWKQAKELGKSLLPFSEQPHIHQNNWGVSYLYNYDPIHRYYINTGKVNRPTRYGSFMSRNPLVSQPKRMSTTIHEGVHDWTSNFLLRESGQEEAIRNLLPENVRTITDKWSNLRNKGIDPIQEMGQKEARLGYLADPTEVHARIMELRNHFGMTPEYSKNLTSEQASAIMKNLKSAPESSPIELRFFDVVDNDPDKLASLFRRLWAVPAATTLGIGAAQQFNQKPKGTYQMGGETSTEENPKQIAPVNITVPRYNAYKYNPNARSPLAKNYSYQDTPSYKKSDQDYALMQQAETERKRQEELKKFGESVFGKKPSPLEPVLKAVDAAAVVGDVVTDVAQLGNFIPHPYAQAIGKVGNVLGAGIDLYQGTRDVARGDYGSAALNFGASYLPIHLNKKGYLRPISQVSNTYSGGLTYRPLNYLPWNNAAQRAAMSPYINTNRKIAGAILGETAYDAGAFDNNVYNTYRDVTMRDNTGRNFNPLFRKPAPVIKEKPLDWSQHYQMGGTILAEPDYDIYKAPKQGNYLLPDINRPYYTDEQGEKRSEYKMGFNIDGKETLLPSVVGGRQLTPEETVNRYRQTGLHMGQYNTPEEAEYASRLRTAKYNMLQDPVRFNASMFQGGGKKTYVPEQVTNWTEPKYVAGLNSEGHYGYSDGTIYYNPNSSVENINNPWWTEHEKYHHFQTLTGRNPEERRMQDLQNQEQMLRDKNFLWKLAPKKVLDRGLFKGKYHIPGAEDLMYGNPNTLEGEARLYEEYIRSGNKSIFPQATYQMGGTMGIPGVNGQVVSSGPTPLTSVKKTRGPINKTKAGVKTMSNKQVKKILKNIK